MGETNEQLLGAIKHYQDGLERYAKNKNDAKLMHCIAKLYKLPIKVQHLEITGIGRTVNGLRKLGGEIGDHAKTLVAKWKEMVVEEEEKKPEESALDASKIPATREEANSGEEKSRNHSQDRQKSSHSTENHRDEKNSKHKKPKDDKRGHDVSKSKVHESKHKTSDDSSNSKSKHSKRKSSNKSDDDGSSVSKHNKVDSSRNITDSDSEENDERSHKNRHKYEKLATSKRRLSSEDSSEEEEIDRHKSKYKKHKYVEDSEEEEESDHRSKHISLSKKETHRNSDEKRKPKVDTKLKKHDDKQKKRSSDKHEKHEKSKKEQTKSKIDCSKEVKNVNKDIETKPKNKQESSAPDKKGKSKSSKGSSSSSSKVHQHALNGIDSGSGASFAEALGMCMPLSSKTVYKKKNSPKEKDESPPHFAEDVPPLLKEPPPLEPLDVSISSLLPAITPNYRPLGLSTDPLHKKILTDDEALSRVMSTKNQRTKVFSGNKCVWNKVPSLFEICIRILQDNIDALEYTGGVPYSILKPILEKATADQLYMMEHHNPYLIEDSDELWKLHCQKEFRNKSREELETWRDMYMRCLDEREAKLKALTANIKEAQDKSIPVRTTKLAYVDSFVKPPRNVARKQARNGTAFDARPAMTPTAKAASLAVAGEAGKIAVPNPGARAGDRSSSKQGGGHAAIKPKKAPLMAKTLSLFKNRFRR